LSKVGKILRVYSLIVGVTSTAFMLLVFYTEAFMHMGRLFIEPNLYIATTEFFMVLIGLVVLGIMLFISTFPESEPKQEKNEERTGYETNNRAAYA